MNNMGNPQQQGFGASSLPQNASYEDTLNYYQQEACRLYIANVVLTNQVKEMLQEKTDILAKISRMEKRQQENLQHLAEEKKKRHRRAAHEIERHYRCPCDPCSKSYGSEGSLAQHIKIKHPAFFNTISNNISQTLSALRQDGPPSNLDDDSDLISQDDDEDEEEQSSQQDKDQSSQFKKPTDSSKQNNSKSQPAKNNSKKKVKTNKPKEEDSKEPSDSD